MGKWMLFVILSSVAATTVTESAEEERFRWKGQVDGVDEIQIRGESVRVHHLEAKPIQRQDHRFTAPLPKRDVHLKLHKIEGRGKVRLVEEPSSWNDYTATVRIEDRKSGDSFYDFELLWKSDDWEDWEHSEGDHSREWGEHFESRREGVFRWAGRVDVGADIEIRGNEHTVHDKGGTQERRARFRAELPQDDVPVSLHKIEGRGRVELIQSHERSNGYTAIVRIEDRKGGADDYEFELSWPQR